VPTINESILKRPRRYCAALMAVAVVVSLSRMPVALAQIEPAPPGQVSTGDPDAGDLSQGAASTQNTVPDPYYNASQYTTLVDQQAEQNTTAVAQNVEQQLWPDFGAYNETYDNLSSFGGPADDDYVGIAASVLGSLGDLVFQQLKRLFMPPTSWSDWFPGKN